MILTFLFAIPLLFSFGVHFISCKHYSYKSKTEIEIEMPVRQVKNLIEDKHSYINFLPEYENLSFEEKNNSEKEIDSTKECFLFGGKCKAQNAHNDMIFLKSGKSFMIGFKLKCGSHIIEYSYTITPSVKGNESRSRIVLDSKILYNSQGMRALLKIFNSKFKEREEKSLNSLVGYLEVF